MLKNAGLNVMLQEVGSYQKSWVTVEVKPKDIFLSLLSGCFFMSCSVSVISLCPEISALNTASYGMKPFQGGCL